MTTAIELEKMRKEQLKLAQNIVLRDEYTKVKVIAGCDCTFEQERAIAAIAVLEYPSMKLLETTHAIQEEAMSYLQGYEAYRELPAIVAAISKLKNKPDIIFCDGNGILHQRKIGVASHLGIAVD